MAEAVTARTAARPRAAQRQRLTNQLGQSVIPRFVLILMCAVYLMPLYWMLVTALKSNQELAAYPPTLWPHDAQWGNFKDAVNAIPFGRFLANTTTVAVLTVIGAIISNPVIAYGFSRIEWPGRDKVFYLVLATVFMPYPAIMVALFDIFAKLDWVNTFYPLVVPIFFGGQAFWIFLMRQFLLQIPQDVTDAARIDGASEFRIMVQIIMPMALPAIGAVSIFAAVHAWNDFLGPLLYLQDESKYTLAIGLTFFSSQHDVRFNLLMAASILVIIPVVIAFFLFQRAFVEGVTVGSIK